jgi:lysophospholipase L1-like esterase
MKQLEEQLNKNEELMEQKQKEYEESLKEEQDNWNSIMADLESGEEKIKDAIDKMPVISIGDSVMLGAANSLYRVFPKGYVDAKVSRADCEVPSILRSLKRQNKIGEVVVIGLGTNGSCGNGTRNEILSILKDKKVFWLTVTNDRQVHINSHIRALADNNSNVYLVDWENISKGHRDYFASDGIHLTGTGQSVYSKTIYDAIYKVYIDEFNDKKNGIINEHEKEMKEKITFYGNDLIINAFDDIKENFLKTDFKLDKDYNYEKLLSEIKDGVENNNINHRIVFAFDKQANISKDNYLELLSILTDYEVYIVSFDNKLEFNNNVKVIDFNSELTNHPEYLMADRIHLTNEANKTLSIMLDKIINNKSE